MIMAQILSVLALSTKAMSERRISELIDSLCPFLADHDPETFLKKLVGRREVEDALLRLDSLTKEESLMAVARNLEATHFVDRIVRGVDTNVKAAKEGMHYFLSPCLYRPFFSPLRPKTEAHEIKRLLLPDTHIAECRG